MKNLMYLGITLFSVFIGSIAIAEEKFPKPTLIVQGTNVFNLGHIKGIGTSNVIFKLKNEGTEALKITRMYASCPCLTAACEKKDVLPGEETEVHVALNLAQVRGDFTRNVTIFSDKRGPSETKLFLTGIIEPVVSGFPEEVVTLTAASEGIAFTNAFDLTVHDLRYKLGTPRLKFPTGMNIEATLADARLDAGKHIYGLTMVASVLARGQYRAEIVVPVIGEPRQEDVKILFHVHGGLVLFAAPQRLELQDDVTGEQRFKLVIRGNRPVALDPAKLTWQPNVDGLTITAGETRRAAQQNRASKNEALAKRPTPVAVTVTMTPGAVDAILGNGTPALIFSYPDFGDVEVKVSR